MVGIGCGRDWFHADELPLDTIWYLLRANEIADKFSELRNRFLLLTDKNVSPHKFEKRRDQLQMLLHQLGLSNKWQLIYQSEVHKNSKIKSENVKINGKIPREDIAYFQDEVVDAISLVPDGLKIGWAIDKKGWNHRGWEVHFDEIIKENTETEFQYCRSGMNFDGKRRAPYLIHRELPGVCIPTHRSGIEQEIEKISQVNIATLYARHIDAVYGNLLNQTPIGDEFLPDNKSELTETAKRDMQEKVERLLQHLFS